MKPLANRNPVSLILAALLAAALACNLPGSEGATPVPPDEPTTPVDEPASPPAPTATSDPASLCPSPTADLALHLDPNNGVCFLYPSYYEIADGFERPDRVVTLIGPASEPIGQKQFAVILAVEHNGPDEGMSASSYADRSLELFNMPSDGAREEISVAGRSATVLHDLPGAFVSERRAYLIANGERYVVSLIPEVGDIPELTDESNLAWNTLLESIVFFPPQDPPEYVSPDAVCPSPDGDTRLLLDIVDGFCYLYPSDFAEDPDLPDRIVGGPVLGSVEGFDDVRSSLTLGTFGAFPDSTPRQVLEPRLEVNVDPDSVRDEVIGGWPAVVFRGIGGPWDARNAIIVVDGYVYTIVNQPWEPDQWPDGIAWLDRLWDSVTGSVAFFTRWR